MPPVIRPSIPTPFVKCILLHMQNVASFCAQIVIEKFAANQLLPNHQRCAIVNAFVFTILRRVKRNALRLRLPTRLNNLRTNMVF